MVVSFFIFYKHWLLLIKSYYYRLIHTLNVKKSKLKIYNNNIGFGENSNRFCI